MTRLIFVVLVLQAFAFDVPAQAASTDEDVLKKLNLEITAAEDRGDSKWLEGVIGSELAFRRASGALVGRDQFLKDVKARDKTSTKIESVKLYGKDRAIVTSIVTMKIDGNDTSFHNLRMFVRHKDTWQLIGWANEKL